MYQKRKMRQEKKNSKKVWDFDCYFVIAGFEFIQNIFF